MDRVAPPPYQASYQSAKTFYLQEFQAIQKEKNSSTKHLNAWEDKSFLIRRPEDAYEEATKRNELAKVREIFNGFIEAQKKAAKLYELLNKAIEVHDRAAKQYTDEPHKSEIASNLKKLKGNLNRVEKIHRHFEYIRVDFHSYATRYMHIVDTNSDMGWWDWGIFNTSDLYGLYSQTL